LCGKVQRAIYNCTDDNDDNNDTIEIPPTEILGRIFRFLHSRTC
jgi:hypothetical protein